MQVRFSMWLVTSLWIVSAFAIQSPVAVAAEDDAAGASFVTTRWGQTPQGATRVVFQLDGSSTYDIEKVPGANAVDVFLPGAAYSTAPTSLQIANGVIDQVTFRPSASGTVARVVGAAGELRTKAFALTNPDRVVVDVFGKPATTAPKASPQVQSAPAPRRETQVAEPPKTEADLSAKTEPAEVVEPKSQLEAAKMAAEKAVAKEPLAKPQETPETPRANPTTDESEFDSLVSWIHVLKAKVEALNGSETEGQRARHRRSLAFLLADRGIYIEAEKALATALETEGVELTTAFADSIYLAELRVRTNNTEGATEIIKSLVLHDVMPEKKLRIAKIMIECDMNEKGANLLSEVVPQLAGPARSEAQLLLARSLWQRGQITEALSHVKPLTASREAPAALKARALVLHGDCLWAMGNPTDAKDLYKRAANADLSPEEASWTTLQLGNLARREGDLDEAKSLYREAIQRWPETFYASQADWFLRVAEEMERLIEAGASEDRG